MTGLLHPITDSEWVRLQRPTALFIDGSRPLYGEVDGLVVVACPDFIDIYSINGPEGACYQREVASLPSDLIRILAEQTAQLISLGHPLEAVARLYGFEY